MKKIILLTLLILCSILIKAQDVGDNVEVILNNGYTIKGTIIDKTNESIRVSLKGGEIQSINIEDIKKMNTLKIKIKKIDSTRFFIGADFLTNNFFGGLPGIDKGFDVVFGIRTSKYFSVQIGIKYYYYNEKNSAIGTINSQSDFIIPIQVNCNLYTNSKFKFYTSLDIFYSYRCRNKELGAYNQNAYKLTIIDSASFLGGSVGLGLEYNITKHIKINVGADCWLFNYCRKGADSPDFNYCMFYDSDFCKSIELHFGLYYNFGKFKRKK